MSYRVRMEVSGLDTSRVEAVKEGLRSAWDFSEISEVAGTVFCFGQGELAPDGEEEAGDRAGLFADQMARAVWEAHGGFCQVVTLVAGEGEAFRPLTRDRGDYSRLIGQRR